MSNPDFAKLMEDLQQIVHDVESVLSSAASDVSDTSHSTQQRARDAIHKVKAQINDLGEQATQHARAASAATHQYVQNNPWQSLGIAAGLGVLIGLLLRRRD